MGVTDSGISGGSEFPVTSWSAIVRARDDDSPENPVHLRRLVELYWRPVYWVIRHASGKSHDDAKDLTQEFFAAVVFERSLLHKFAPARGSFRALLRAALDNFMADCARRAGRQKRGGGAVVVSLGALDDGDENVPGDVPDVLGLTPDRIFDLAWNRAVMSMALSRLDDRLDAEGRSVAKEVFRRYDVEGDSTELSYEDLGRELQLTGAQVKHALLSARAAFREITTEIVRDYVDRPEDLAAELRQLFGA